MESRIKSLQIDRGISSPFGAQETVSGERVFDIAFIVNRSIGIADVRIAGLNVLWRWFIECILRASKSKRGLSLNLPTQYK